ncbi:hypothetical protein A1D22_03160 [Pasteurellaceae bacterium LFhippo2]|nr:hypothetical protein [Pasteurellaceae bacterium LFhippo2]
MLKKMMIALAIVSSATAFAEEAKKEKEVVIKVPEMHCQLCAYTVNKSLREVEGVVTTKASIKDRQVKVVADEKVDNEALLQAVRKLEYTPEIQ